MSKLRNGVAALIIKDKNKDLKFGGVTKVLELDRRSNETVIAQARLFSTAVQSYNGMVLEKKEVDNDMPDVAEACDDYLRFTRLASANSMQMRRWRKGMTGSHLGKMPY